MFIKRELKFCGVIIFLCFFYVVKAQDANAEFKVLGFYTAKKDLAHISFVHEANEWFSKIGKQYHFSYDSTSDWNKLNTAYLSKFTMILFLDTRPDSLPQRKAFEQYMKNGGSWMGFHFSAFALADSDFPQNWNWYHNEFLASGEYVSNTWRPTSAILRVEDSKHPILKGLPATFTSAPNEWYRWKEDLRKNKDIKILISIDTASFPLGTGPKEYEIWHTGYYPVVWTNSKYRMIYFNMGHNDMDYEGGSNRSLSSSFSEPMQNKLIIDALLWLCNAKTATNVK